VSNFKIPPRKTPEEWANMCLAHVDLSCVSVPYRNETIPRVFGACRASEDTVHESRWAIKMPVIHTAVPSKFHRPVPGIGWLRKSAMWSVHVKGANGHYVHLGNFGKLLDACVVRMTHDRQGRIGIFREHGRTQHGKDAQNPDIYFLKRKKVWTCDLVRPYVKGSPRSPGLPMNLGIFESFEDAEAVLDEAHKILRIGAYSPTAYSKRKEVREPHGFELVDGVYVRSEEWLRGHGV